MQGRGYKPRPARGTILINPNCPGIALTGGLNNKTSHCITPVYRTHIVDITGDAMVFEVIGTAETIDEVIKSLSALGLDGVSRTGVVAGFKGDKKLKSE